MALHLMPTTALKSGDILGDLGSIMRIVAAAKRLAYYSETGLAGGERRVSSVKKGGASTLLVNGVS